MIELMPGCLLPRRRLEDLIQMMVDALDRADGDPEAEIEWDEDDNLWMKKAR